MSGSNLSGHHGAELRRVSACMNGMNRTRPADETATARQETADETFVVPDIGDEGCGCE
jgi:hypothetical protein